MPRSQCEIDFVLTWVNGDDPDWRAARERFPAPDGADVRPERYRDWGWLRWWLRGVERFAPWVRCVHLVAAGALPDWLDTAHPKLHIVRHEDILPPEALPCFNGNALEVNLHRIPGLTEQFVYFNDDMLLLRPTAPEDFFRDGKPRDMLAAQPVIANPDNPVMSSILLNDSLVISRHFRKREVMRRHTGRRWHVGYPLKYFGYNLLETAFPQYTGFYTVHGPSPLLRRSFEEPWDLEPEPLRATTARRFRSAADVTQYLFREWEKQRGNFVPANVERDLLYFEADDVSGACAAVRARKRKMICINDTGRLSDFAAARTALEGAFAAVLPEASSFEAAP